MEGLNKELLECKHCNQTGTCSTGLDGMSCSACIKAHDLKGHRFIFWKVNHYGLSCGSCNGLLKADPVTFRMQKRVVPVLALLVTLGFLVLSSALAVMDESIIPQIITGWLALTSSVMGYYFSSVKRF